ncbi:MAG TPA: condensation domain-containing protein, partial [Clostridia bacterium]
MDIKNKHRSKRFKSKKLYMSYFKALKTLNNKSTLDFYNAVYKAMRKNKPHFNEPDKENVIPIDAEKPDEGSLSTVDNSNFIIDNSNVIIDNSNFLIANGHDIYNYVARYGLANFQLQAVLKLNGKLDFAKLSEAARLSIEEEPVFKCRFVEGNPPYWKREESIDQSALCSFEAVNNTEEAVQRFLESSLDMDNDPMIKIRLICSEAHDTLCIKFNHACCDGIGTKEYLQLLSKIYSALDSENGIFIPIPKTRGRIDQDRLFKELGITDQEAMWIPGSDISTPTWAFPWKHGTSNDIRVVVSSLSAGQLDEMKIFGKSRKVTINDIILAAYYRAMLKTGEPAYAIPMEVPVTIDLRRHLPDHKTEAIRNFSGSANTRITMMESDSFDDTLSKVANAMNDIKSHYPGLQSAIGLERLEKISFQETLNYYQATKECPVYYGDKCVPTLSNLGFISDSKIKFGKIVATDAYIVPPVVRAPGLLLMVSTYNGILTLAAGYYEGTVLRDDVDRI